MSVIKRIDSLITFSSFDRLLPRSPSIVLEKGYGNDFAPSASDIRLKAPEGQKEWSPLPNRFERRSSTSTLRLSAVYGVILKNQNSSMIPGPLADILTP